eukprot:6490706-Amphidinium_carterae.1
MPKRPINVIYVQHLQKAVPRPVLGGREGMNTRMIPKFPSANAFRVEHEQRLEPRAQLLSANIISDREPAGSRTFLSSAQQCHSKQYNVASLLSVTKINCPSQTRTRRASNADLHVITTS